MAGGENGGVARARSARERGERAREVGATRARAGESDAPGLPDALVPQHEQFHMQIEIIRVRKRHPAGATREVSNSNLLLGSYTSKPWPA